MHRLLTAKEAKALDHYTIEQIGVPSLVLMERAALATAEECIKRMTLGARVLCACGMGNNGADGVATARILHLRGYAAKILLAGNEAKATEEMKCQLRIARNLNIPICKADEEAEYIKSGEYELIVDALFGVGLARNVEGLYASLVEQMNQSRAKLVSVDIPSGVSADDGSVLGCAVKAAVTVTFGTEKLGMILYPGTECCGERVTADIGLAQEMYFAGESPQSESEKAASENVIPQPAFAYDKEDVKRLPARPAYSNKGTFGRVLVIAGSANMGGAALFAGMAAYRMGAGLVEIATVAENRTFLMERLPEAVLTVYDTNAEPGEWLAPAVKRAKAVVVGPGMGVSDLTKKILTFLLDETDIPLVIDADGLNVLAAFPELAELLSGRVILTPHLGEMSRLTGKSVRALQTGLIQAASDYSKATGAVCVMKDARTIVAAPDGRVYVNTSGNCGMAAGGSGDLLAGILGALRAEGMDSFESACLGVYLHGLYGDKARERYGVRTMIASDFGEMIGEALV